MSKLPADVSPRDVLKVLAKFGFHVKEGRRHTVCWRGEGNDRIVVTVPRHGTIKRGLLSGILDDAGITREQFVEWR